MARLTNLHPNGHPCEASVIVTSECEVALWRDLFNPNPWDLPTVFPWEDGHLCGKHLNHRDLHHPRHGKWIAIHLAPVRSLHHWRVILGIKFQQMHRFWFHYNWSTWTQLKQGYQNGWFPESNSWVNQPVDGASTNRPTRCGPQTLSYNFVYNPRVNYNYNYHTP